VNPKIKMTTQRAHVTDQHLPRYEIASQIFPEIEVIPKEELSPLSSCGCPPQLLFSAS